MLKTFTTRLELKSGSDDGAVRAAFSIFNTRDSTGDVVRPSFFTDGQEIPMAAWGHSWESLPPGKGVIRVREDYAEFDGHFFTDTTHGLDHYRTVKHMGGLQEWSFGFSVLDAEYGEQDGEPTRFLTRGETYEASPVLVGAHRDTHTLSIKSADLKRRLNREQMDRIIAVFLEALAADEADTEDVAAGDDGKAADPPTFDLATAKLLDDLTAYLPRLRAASAEDVVAAKDQMAGLLRSMGSARVDLDALLKRADVLGQSAPRELFAQFQRIDGLYGPHQSRQAG